MKNFVTRSKSIDRECIIKIFSVVAVEAAYNHCDIGISVKDYVNENEKLLEALEENMKEFVVMPREGTYLLWIDYALGVSEDELRDWFINEARLNSIWPLILAKMVMAIFV